jgi:hypothetical protein
MKGLRQISPLLVLLCLAASHLVANESCVETINAGKVHITIPSPCKGQYREFRSKAEIIAELCTDLVKEKKFDSDLFINFQTLIWRGDTSSLKVEFKEEEYYDYRRTKDRTRKATGLVITFADRDIDILRTLYCVNKNIDSLKGRTENADELKKILSQKIFRKKIEGESRGKLTYYFQEGVFHIIDPFPVYEPRNTEIFTCKNVYELYGEYEDGTFLFTCDTIFHFIRNNEVSKALTLQLKKSYPFSSRPQIDKILLEYLHSDSTGFVQKYILYLYWYEQKVLFLPKYDLVVSDYTNLERSIVDSIIKSATLKKELKSQGKIMPTAHFAGKVIYTLSGILILILSLALLRNRRK